VRKFAALFFCTMGISGAEAVVAAASPFLGQGESAVLVKDYLPMLTRAEVHQVMTSGFATIAGSVFSAYVSMGINPTALMSSCVMSIPASIAISKMRYPESDNPLTMGTVAVPESENQKDRPLNALQAFSNGSWLGIKIAGMIVASVLCILALLGLANGLLGWWGSYLNISDPKLTVQLVLGYFFYPVAFLLGVERDGDLLLVARLIGIKVIANEFVAVSSSIFAIQKLPAIYSADTRYKVR
jgi:CNT family concentrative nucleoside transporter